MKIFDAILCKIGKLLKNNSDIFMMLKIHLSFGLTAMVHKNKIHMNNILLNPAASRPNI